MKNKTVRNQPYAALIKKILLQMLVMLLTAIVVVVLISLLGQGRIANLVTSIISRVFGIGWEAASSAYFRLIRSRIDTIMAITVIIFFIIMCRFLLTWLTKYFDDIVRGVNHLAEESQDKISMSIELNFMEKKLNQVKDELDKRAKKAQEAEQRKNDLVIYLAHDIKTPLTSVIGYLSLLDETPDMSAEQKEKYIHITLDKAYRLESLINEFFEITRYNLQTVLLNKNKFDLYYMLVQIADEAYPQLAASGRQIQIHADENITIYGDADKLARVFNNILKNAMVYSDAGSVIDISAEKRDSAAVIRFKNAGTIPQNKLGFIFEKFYRLDDARSTATGGAGLGLAIARDIITLHGGSIEAESKDTHTVFIITLPNIS